MSNILTPELFEVAGVPVSDAPRVVSDGLVRHQPILSRAEILRQGAEAIMQLASGHSWNDWVKVMWALDIARTSAMLEAGINKPTGRKYSEAFARWLRCHNDFELIGKLDKSDRSRLFECLQSLDAINTWRASLPPHRLLKLNYPPTVLSRWKQSFLKNTETSTTETDAAATVTITLGMVLAWLTEASAADKKQSRRSSSPLSPRTGCGSC